MERLYQDFYAQPHAEEVCRRSGAWGARRVVKINIDF